MADSVPTTRRKKSLQAALDQAEDDRRRKLLSQRIDIARTGVLSYQRHRVGDAVKSFHNYIRILEELKGCSEGGLMPTMFDFKRDLQELLLISGVYWDMAKMYDRTQSADRQKEFRHYLHKYIIFSKNMPYQVLCAETMRKFLNTSKPVHLKEFKAAYAELSNGKCFVVTSLVDVIDPRALPYWRAFRDQRLRPHWAGRIFIRVYYAVGPAVAWVVDQMPLGARKALARALSRPLDS